MKYIRTKDGRIYKVIKKHIDCFELESSFDKLMKCHTFMPKSFLGQFVDYKSANTIEELCDEFVEVSKNNCFKPLVKEIRFNNYDESTKKHLLKNSIIYGAIWTEWGLKYVAKMNEKGELELL